MSFPYNPNTCKNHTYHRRETLAYLLGTDFIPGDFRLALEYPCVHFYYMIYMYMCMFV